MSLQAIVDELLEATGATRATIRLEAPGNPYFPVAAEALAPGATSIVPLCSTGILETPPFRFVNEERRVLVQDDVLVSPPLFPEAVGLGIRAQLIAPLERGGRLVGVLSVHDANRPRAWGPVELAALDAAVARVHEELGATDRGIDPRPPVGAPGRRP